MCSENWLVEYLKVSEMEIQIHFTNLAKRMVEKKFQLITNVPTFEAQS